MTYRLIGSAAVAGESTWTRYPRNQRPVAKYPVMLLHGANTPDQYEGNTWPSALQFASTLARGSAASSYQGVPCISGYLAGNGFGNGTSVGRVAALHAYLAAQIGCSAAKRINVGTSMGAGIGLLDAIANPSKVAGIVGVVPMASAISLHKRNPGGPIATGFTQQLAAAWGTGFTVLTVTLTNGSTAVVATAGNFTSGMVGNYVVKNVANQTALDTTVPIGATVAAFTDATHATLSAPFTGATGSYQVAIAQPLPSGADIIGQAGALAGIPTRLYYSTVDPYIDPADVTALAAAIGASAQAIAVDSTYGHANGTWAEVGTYNSGSGFSDLIAWLVSNGA